jgi:hypothetical protein
MLSFQNLLLALALILSAMDVGVAQISLLRSIAMVKKTLSVVGWTSAAYATYALGKLTLTIWAIILFIQFGSK